MTFVPRELLHREGHHVTFDNYIYHQIDLELNIVASERVVASGADGETW